jgi:hypothetical protein
MIKRKGYTYVRNGKKVKVKSTMIKDMGKPGKTPKSERVLPKLKPGKLSKYGYETNLTNIKRKKALINASKYNKKISKKKMLKTMRRLNVLKTYTKKSQPKNSFIYDKDYKWLRTKYKKLT